MLQKTRFDCSMFSINKRLYYCHGPVIMGSQLSTWFIQNHHCIAFFYSWLIWLPPLSSLINLWNTFFCLNYSWFLVSTLFLFLFMVCLKLSPSLVVIFYFNACDDSTVWNIWFTDHLHAYNRILKIGMIWCLKRITPPVLPIIKYF